MTKLKKCVWGRELQLDVSYDCFDDEEVLPSQEEALSGLLEHWSAVDASLNEVKLYCEKASAGEVRADQIQNVFKYVAPRSLFVLRKPENTVALMCEFKFDPEHGMAVVFKDGELLRIGTQSSVL